MIEVRETEGSTRSNNFGMDRALQQSETTRKFTKPFTNAVFVELSEANHEYHKKYEVNE